MVPFPLGTTKMLFPYVIPSREYEVPEVLKVHEVPSDEVRMVPPLPTATKMLFP